VLDKLKSLWPKFRYVLSLLLLAWLFQRVHWTEIVPKKPGMFNLLVLAVIIGVAAVLLSILRWQRVLVALGKPTRLSVLARYYFAAMFVSNFVPSTVGGDLVRVTWLRRRSGLGDAVASVVLERLTGWIVLPFITLGGLLANPQLLRLGSSSRLVVATAMVTLLALVVVVGLATILEPKSLEIRGGIFAVVDATRYGIKRLTTNPKGVIEVLSVSFAYQLTMVISALAVADALGLGLPLTAMLVFVPAVAILQVVPLTIGGLGLREGAFVLFLHPLGVSTSQAVALGLLIYIVNVAVSLIGVPAFAMGADGQSVSVSSE
jgi:uncharacterized protein (TIRG00374 family)